MAQQHGYPNTLPDCYFEIRVVMAGETNLFLDRIHQAGENAERGIMRTIFPEV